jgi:Uma2 family endonuclease
MTAMVNPHNPINEEGHIVLYDVSWETYEQLLIEYEDRPGHRLTYDQGVLEIMPCTLPHEKTSHVSGLLVNVICEERELDVEGLGQLTHRRRDLKKGLEPDQCFYIQNVKVTAGHRTLDLSILAPVDLAIEVEQTNPVLPKLPIYAALGIPELWLSRDNEIRFLQLNQSRYVEIKESVCLPRISSVDITRLVNDAGQMKRPQWLRRVREWVRSLN